MQSNDESKEINVKNYKSYYFDDIMRVVDIDFTKFYKKKNHMKIFCFTIFDTKLLWAQNHCILALIKQMDLLEFIMKLDIQYYLILKDMMKIIELN